MIIRILSLVEIPRRRDGGNNCSLFLVYDSVKCLAMYMSVYILPSEINHYLLCFYILVYLNKFSTKDDNYFVLFLFTP